MASPCPPVSLFTCICSRWLKHFAQCVIFCSIHFAQAFCSMVHLRSISSHTCNSHCFCFQDTQSYTLALRLRGGTTILLFLARIAGQNAIHTSLVRLFTFSVVAQPTTMYRHFARCRLQASMMASQCAHGKLCIGLRKLSGARIAGQNAIH